MAALASSGAHREGAGEQNSWPKGSAIHSTLLSAAVFWVAVVQSHVLLPISWWSAAYAFLKHPVQLGFFWKQPVQVLHDLSAV